ncbi:MAG: HlyD family efflux transporter periplasmic adaptor subunit [Planctomycetota bacterium]|nr:HlyD family efflux transporter periplasmic adaptor subunit [Planctomycetota bacterium]
MLTRVIFSLGITLGIGLGFFAIILGTQEQGQGQDPASVRQAANRIASRTGTLGAAGTRQSTKVQEAVSRFDNLPSTQVTRSSAGNFLLNRKCRVQLIHDVDVPALEAGQIKSILVKENQLIDPRQPIALLRDDAAQLQKEVAEKNRNVAEVDAENINRINYAKKSLEFAQDVYKRKQLLYEQRNSISYVEFAEARYQESQAQLQLDEAFSQQKVAREKLGVEDVNIRAADDLINRHQVSSLLKSAEVADIYVQVGEWVNRGDKVARVIQMDRLKILGRADSKELFPWEIQDRPVVVTLQLPQNQTTTFNGKVVRVNAENTVSGKFFFEVEVENRKRENFWLLRPNAEVEIRVTLKENR